MNIDGSSVTFRRISITKSKRRPCLTTTLSEILKLSPNTVILKLISRYKSIKSSSVDEEISGVVLLYLDIVPAAF